MNNENAMEVNRRDFIKIGSTGAATVAFAGLGAVDVSGQQTPAAASATNAAAAPQQPAQLTGKLPTRRYGKTELQVSTIVGASDWSPDVIPAAVQLGVNYWHKAQRWDAHSMPEAIKSQPRESYYLECVVDRPGGYLEGTIDEEKHYQFVKSSVAKSGAGYYDVMKFHFGYHSVDEAKNQLGMVNAFQRLKKEGLVKHLAISQHHFENNPKVQNGQTAYDILPWVMDNLPYEASQFFYTYGDGKPNADCKESSVEALINLSKQKDFGVIAMKTMGGVGRAATDPRFQTLLTDPKYAGSTPGTSMVKWLMSNPSITAATIMTKNFDQLQENLKAAMQPAMTANDRNNLDLLAAFNKGTTCLLCADCATHCPEEIAIVDILRYERYAMDYHDLPKAKAEYKTLTKNGTSCIACGDCMPSCKADINIISKLKEVHNLLS
jgi:predicted aldo/keto reductase-like oxidoreductase